MITAATVTSPLGLAASLVLVLVAVVLSLLQRLRLERTLVWAALRAVVQLLLVGLALTYVIAPTTPILLSWLWVVAMIVVAAVTVERRAREVPAAFVIALIAFAAAAAISLGVLFGLHVFPMSGQTVIPLAGMVIGNSMASAVLVSRRIVDSLRDSRDEVEARLALGLPSAEAARPYLRAAVRTALIPQIETTKVVGLIALPGAMTGLILAGVKPLQAVMVQAAIMFLVLGAVATTTAVVALELQRRMFTRDHRLRRIPSVKR